MKDPGNPAIDLKAIFVRPVAGENQKQQAHEFLDSCHYHKTTTDFFSAMNARHHRYAFRSLFAAHPSFSLAS